MAGKLPPGRPVLKVALFLLLNLLLFEGMVRLCVGQGWLPYQTYPTHRQPRYWASIDPAFGVWRYPDTRFRHVEKCIDAVYTTNTVGARDKERSVDSADERRVVVLGDSFTEGLGVGDGDRFTDLLEARTGVEHLNFGSAGYFGTIQQWLVYETLAREFGHSDVFVFLYPDNDFDDNRAGGFPDHDYRPYLRRVGDDFELYYTVAFEERDTSSRSWSTVASNAISNGLYTANVLRSAVKRIGDRDLGHNVAAGTSRYDSYDDLHRDVLFHALRRIVDLAGSRQVYLFTIPSLADAAAASADSLQFRLPGELDEFAASRDNVHFKDLLPVFLEAAASTGTEYRDYTLGCDGHWSAGGHAVAAEAVRELAFGP